MEVNRKSEAALSHDFLIHVLKYCKTSGKFTWRVDRGSALAGTLAGSEYKKYIRVKINGVRFAAHRLAWFYVTGSWPENQVDHRNGICDDNRWRNLRKAIGQREQQQNQKRYTTNTSGVPNVYPVKYGRWAVRVQGYDGKLFYKEFKRTEFKEACRIAKEAKQKLHEFNPRHRRNK